MKNFKLHFNRYWLGYFVVLVLVVSGLIAIGLYNDPAALYKLKNGY